MEDRSFEFLAKTSYDQQGSLLKFDFKKNDFLPYRINVLVGENGVGKSSILSDIASCYGFKLIRDGFNASDLEEIKPGSIILFDEPELHLHPDAVSDMMRILYNVLQRCDSYAILATNSPIVVQQTPSRYVHILSRVDSNLIVRHPETECFGENISAVVEDVFDVHDASYKTVLKQLSQKMSYEEVEQLFDGKLSFNAAVCLNNCY